MHIMIASKTFSLKISVCKTVDYLQTLLKYSLAVVQGDCICFAVITRRFHFVLLIQVPGILSTCEFTVSFLNDESDE